MHISRFTRINPTFRYSDSQTHKYRGNADPHNSWIHRSTCPDANTHRCRLPPRKTDTHTFNTQIQTGHAPSHKHTHHLASHIPHQQTRPTQPHLAADPACSFRGQVDWVGDSCVFEGASPFSLPVAWEVGSELGGMKGKVRERKKKKLEWDILVGQ